MALTWQEFNPENMIFEDVKQYTIGNLTFKRIFINYRYDDGKVGKLSIRTPELFSFGIQEYRDKKPTSGENPILAYNMSIVMHNQNETPTEDQQGTIDLFETILAIVQQHLKKPSVIEALDKYKMGPDVDRMTIFYRKEDKGVLVPGYAPSISTKLLTAFEKNRQPGQAPKISTGFYNIDDEPIDPLTLVGARCKIIGDVVVDNIYVGDKPSIQIRLNDAIITEQFNRQRRLFAPAKKATSSVASMFASEDEFEHHHQSPVAEPKHINFVKRKQ